MTTRWLLLLLLLLAGALCGCSNVLGIEEGIAEGPGCDREGALMCDAFQPMRCTSKRWRKDGTECPFSCRDGECVETPPSCPPRTICEGGADCCETIWVPGGDFVLRSDAQLPSSTTLSRSVSGFFLDRFEVTVFRFKQFVSEYPDSLPQPGLGAPPGSRSFVWQSAWLTEPALDPGVVEEAVPSTRETLEQALVSCEGNTFEEGSYTHPINCINWYLAFAFCVWDGGRLPTEAEWQFAASHGAEQRVYPWSVPPHSEFITPEHAWYDELESPGIVGMKAAGRAAFLARQSGAHEDLAGNVQEWVLDGDGEPDDSRCSDCPTPWSTSSRVLRGGSYKGKAARLKNSDFSYGPAAVLRQTYGVRCARDAQTQRETQ